MTLTLVAEMSKYHFDLCDKVLLHWLYKEFCIYANKQSPHKPVGNILPCQELL